MSLVFLFVEESMFGNNLQKQLDEIKKTALFEKRDLVKVGDIVYTLGQTKIYLDDNKEEYFFRWVVNQCEVIQVNDDWGYVVVRVGDNEYKQVKKTNIWTHYETAIVYALNQDLLSLTDCVRVLYNRVEELKKSNQDKAVEK